MFNQSRASKQLFRWKIWIKEVYIYHTFSDTGKYNFTNEKNINAADIAFKFSELIYIQSYKFLMIFSGQMKWLWNVGFCFRWHSCNFPFCRSFHESSIIKLQWNIIIYYICSFHWNIFYYMLFSIQLNNDWHTFPFITYKC